MLQEQRLEELWKSWKGLPTKMVPKQSLEVGLEANSHRGGLDVSSGEAHVQRPFRKLQGLWQSKGKSARAGEC